MSNPVGRPPLFKNPADFDLKVDEYFEKGRRVVLRFDKEGNKTELPVVTITDLMLYLGFSDKSKFWEYEKKPEFSDSVKRARARVEAEYEANLTFNNPAGSIFALKNFGWSDVQKLEHTGKDGADLSLLVATAIAKKPNE